MNALNISLQTLAVLGTGVALTACGAGLDGPLAPSGDARFGKSVITSSTAGATTVTPGAMQGWVFHNDENETIDPALGSFVTGPGSPPLGRGSVQISVSGTQRRNLATYQFRSTPLSELTVLKYSTFNPSAGNGGSATRAGYLQFNVSFNGLDTWQRRLVFLPKDNGTVVQDSWQEWDGIRGGTALWRYSGPTWPGTTTSGSTPRTWSQILSAYPSARLRDSDSFLGIRVGEPYADGYTENIDAITVGTASGSTTFDFEPYRVALSKDDCKDGGWATVRRADGSSFANQGSCVQYVETGA